MPSHSTFRPRAAGVSSLAAALLATAAAPVRAQEADAPSWPRPVPRLLLSAGGAIVPLDKGAVDRERTGALALSASVRQPVWRWLFVEIGAAAFAAPGAGGDYLVLTPVAPLATDTSLRRVRYFDVDGSTEAGTAVLARAGVQWRGGRGRGVSYHGSGGVGRRTGPGVPLTTVALGATTPGRRLRVTLDAERWWYRVDATESTSAFRIDGSGQSTSTRAVRLGLTSTFVRLGVEVPLARP